MEDVEQLQMHHSYDIEMLQKLGQKPGNEIHIHGTHFRPGKQAIHISFNNHAINCWFVFIGYTVSSGSLYQLSFRG